MDLGDGDFRVHVLSKEVLKEAQICPTQDAAVVWVELDMNNLLVMRASYGASYGKSDFKWDVGGGDHSIGVGVGH